MEPPVALAPVFVDTVIVPHETDVKYWSEAPPVPPAAAFTLTRTALTVALVVVIALPGFIVKLSAPAPFVFVLIVTVPEVAPPTLAFRVTASPLARVMAPLPVEVGPATTSVPVVLVSVIGPAPVAVAVKLAPSVSVMNTPPEPAAAVIVAAVVRILAPAVPMPLAPAAGVVRLTVPAPT